MKLRLGLILTAILATPVALFAQESIAGKWQTDDVPAVQAGTAMPAVGRTMILDLTLDGTKASGTLNELGNGDPLTIESGTVDMTAKTLTLVTQPRGVTWNIAVTDENTLTVTGRVFGGGGRGRGAGGPGGAGAPGGGGERAGAPPAGGGAPQAGAGGNGGAGRGGGRGGRGGGGGGGPIVLHRVK